MAYIPGYNYDIFISYAHLDNEKLGGQEFGWIEQFYKDLKILLSRRIGNMDAIRIWWDNKKLDGNKLFDQTIEEGIHQSAILICLTSTAWLNSAYCKKELDTFYRKAASESAGLKVNDRSRIVNVLLNNIPHTQWPSEFSGTLGFPIHDAEDPDDLGDPLDAGTQQFKHALQDVRDALVQLIHAFPKTEDPAPAVAGSAATGNPDEFRIYIGEVADTLRSIRKRIIVELEKKGYTMVCGIPPPDEAAPHAARVRQELEQADLAVHLLDEIPGREITGTEEEWYPQVQASLGLQYARSKVIWVPTELDISAIEEEKYRSFLSGLETDRTSMQSCEYIRGSRSNLTQEIMDIVEQIKSQRSRPVPGGGDKVPVLLDTHYNDQLHALDLSRILIENGIQPFINPQEDNPRTNISQLADRISQVKKLIFFYGNVSRDWVLERMNAALQLIVTRDLPVEGFFVYLVPPHKDVNDISMRQKIMRIEVVDHSGGTGIAPGSLQSFLQQLKGPVA